MEHITRNSFVFGIGSAATTWLLPKLLLLIAPNILLHFIF